MKFLFLYTCLCLSLINVAAQDYGAQLQQGFDKANAGDYRGSLEMATRLFRLHPDDINTYNLIAFNLTNLGRSDEAVAFINRGMVVDPTSYSMYVNAAYHVMTRGDVNGAHSYLQESLKLYPNGFPIEEVLAEFRKVGKNVGKPAAFDALADWYGQQFRTSTYRYPDVQAFYQQLFAVVADQPQKVLDLTRRQAEAYQQLSWHEMTVFVYGFACRWLSSYGHNVEAIQAGETGLMNFKKFGARGNFHLAAFTIGQLMSSYVAVGNDDKVLLLAQEVIDLSQKSTFHLYDVHALNTLAMALDRKGRNADARALAERAYGLAVGDGYAFGIAESANAMCATRLVLQDASEVQALIRYGEEAVRLFHELDMPVLEWAAMGNTALGYWKLRTVEGRNRCLDLHRQLASLQQGAGKYYDAALTLNNVGSMFFSTGQYAEAVRIFEESVALVEKTIVSVSTRERLTLFESQVSAYQFLVYCYAKLGNPAQVLRIMEASRARVMRDKLARKKEYATVTDIQRSLRPDEACVMYSLFSGQELIALVIKPGNAEVLLLDQPDFISVAKKKYMSRIDQEHQARSGRNFKPSEEGDFVSKSDFDKVTQLTRKFLERPGVGDEVLADLLKGYYGFLIQPLSSRLQGVKSLLIGPDESLAFLPFEALMDASGTYLTEKFEVRYLQSAGVWKQLLARQYDASRKPLLAMGGAVFQAMHATPMPLETYEDWMNLQIAADDNEMAGKTQESVYASLFTKPMMALPGTLEEVNNLKKTVPGAVVFTGQDMSEARIKNMSRTGELAKYKVIHLATHGFAIPEVPSLSGIAMSTPTVTGTEDGFLTTYEFASLSMQCDLVVLSACQTALGKIYAGEGVIGLAQSILIGGSNAAMVSLWPVNDTSTMAFMTGLYNSSGAGKTYAQSSTELKRRFIKGEFGDQFRHPNFWAPFVYYGR